MQALQFIKLHLITLLCGVVAVIAIVFCVLGMSSDKVVKAMDAEAKRTGASSIRSLKSDPKNEEVIAKEKLHGELFENEYVKTVEVANNINARKVLMLGVFPQPEKTATPFEFREAYKRAMKILPTKLDAGTLPKQAEIQEEAQNVEDLLLLEAEQKAEEEGEEAESTARTAPTGRRPFAPSASGGRYFPPVYGGGGRVAPAGMGRVAPAGMGRMAPSGMGRMPSAPRVPAGKSDEPKYNPRYRAEVAKAKSILCYYDQASFHHSPLEYQDEAPTLEEMWFAQIVSWVQEDVVQAIKELNREAADQVTSGDACVENVPVKRLVVLRVLGYEVPGPEGRIYFQDATGSGGAQLPPASPSLTGRKSNEQYDVVRFVVSVVIDQRDILRLIDRISRVNFYQCLGVSYEAVNQQMEMGQGYFYGTDPVVKATLEFEGYMAREVYEGLMPAAVRKMLGIDREDEGD